MIERLIGILMRLFAIACCPGEAPQHAVNQAFGPGLFQLANCANSFIDRGMVRHPHMQ